MHQFTSGEYAYGLWSAVLFNVVLFGGFLFAFAKPKTKVDWRSMGLFSSFLVALFVEMYGFPLTIYLLTGWLGSNYPVATPFTHENGHLLGVFFGVSSGHFTAFHVLSNVFIVIGALIISAGWKAVHEDKGQVATRGLYGYVRHPQYSGFILVILGFLVQWPTIITLVMAPILIVRYILLARREEKYMRATFREDYSRYAAKTPRFIPKLKSFFNERKESRIDSDSGDRSADLMGGKA